VIVLGNDMRARITSKGVDETRVLVVRDGTEIRSAGAPLPPLDLNVIRAIRGDSKFVLLHAGQSRILRRVGHTTGSRENTRG